MRCKKARMRPTGRFLSLTVVLMASMLIVSVPARAANSAAALGLLEAKSDYASAVKKLAGPSQRGINARAGYEIAKIYEFCGVFWGPKTKADWLSLYQKTVAANDPARGVRMALADRRYSQCESLMQGPDIYKERSSWLVIAAEQGDLPAKLVLHQESGLANANKSAFTSELKLAMDSDDPLVVWELSRSLRLASLTWADLSKKPWPGKDLDGIRAVYQLAACELGYPCGPGSTLIEGFCIRGTCTASSYQTWLPSFLEPLQLKAVQAELPRVLKAIRKKRGATLIFKS